MIHYQTLYEMWLEVGLSSQVRSAKLVVGSTNQLEEIENEISEKDLHGNSALWAWRRIKEQIDAAGVVVQLIGVTILLTSAIGIGNTLVASVVQRTQEFGVLKSLGMRDRDLGFQIVFEALALAVIGSILATLAAFVIAGFGHQYVSDYVNGRAGEPIQGELIQFSGFSIFAAFAATIIICILASLYPAWRATRLEPIEAMRQK